MISIVAHICCLYITSSSSGVVMTMLIFLLEMKVMMMMMVMMMMHVMVARACVITGTHSQRHGVHTIVTCTNNRMNSCITITHKSRHRMLLWVMMRSIVIWRAIA